MTPPVDVVAAVRRDSAGNYWLCQRNGDGAHGGLEGMWEYPGGKVEPGEQLREAMVRELTEEFSFSEPFGWPDAQPRLPGNIKVGAVLDSIEYQGYRVTFFEVEMEDPALTHKHKQVRWMTPDEVCRVEHLPSGTIFNARHLAPSIYLAGFSLMGALEASLRGLGCHCGGDNEGHEASEHLKPGEREVFELTRSADRELAELRTLLNTPEIVDFDKAVPLEAAHQILRWGTEHDDGKEPEAWYWLVGYLGGKALHAWRSGDIVKAMHHCISTAAALRNMHAHIRSGVTVMRPGSEQPLLTPEGFEAGHAGKVPTLSEPSSLADDSPGAVLR